ncbi:sulfatase family protein [Algibacter mikhailovii]|nr:sulfatase [Algibacter mikhailovii]
MKILICLSGLMLTSFFLPAQSKVVVKPNIIWLMAEDISLDLECYGTKGVQTPNLNRLAAEGMLYNNCFVTNPICSPSRSSMMIGTHQLKINAHNHRSNRKIALPEPYKPFTYWLRESGYTCILGHHGVMGNGRKIDCNFKTQPIGHWDGKENFGLFDKKDEFLPEDQPFFAQIQLVATHRGDWWDEVRAKSKDPVNPDEIELPPYYANHPTIRLDWAKYLDQMEFIDNEVGMIVDELEQKGMADNTVIIFIGDNGRCNLRGKGYLHDPGLRIPLIVYYPKHFKGGQVIDDVISATDITATILDIAGCEIPTYMTGTSFYNKNFNRKEVYSTRDLWDEIEEKSRSISTERWKYIRNDKPDIPWDAEQAYLEFYRPAVHVMRQLNQQGKLSSTEQLFFRTSKPVEELYDLQNDPFEMNNLANNPKYAKTLTQLRERTAQYDNEMSSISDSFKPVSPISVEVLDFVKQQHPEAYKRMLEGEEIGFKTYVNLYKKSRKKVPYR